MWQIVRHIQYEFEIQNNLNFKCQQNSKHACIYKGTYSTNSESKETENAVITKDFVIFNRATQINSPLEAGSTSVHVKK